MPSITSVNAIYLLNIRNLYPVPQQLEGWSADDAFMTDPQETKESYRGIDGRHSAGLVLNLVQQTVTLSADSPSNVIFDKWNAAEKQVRDVYFATGVIYLPSIGLKFTLTNGILFSYVPIPDVAKSLRPRKFVLRYEESIVAPITGAA
jgi:hypothetical protein